MGLLVEVQGKLAVVEYSELSFDPPPEALSSTGILCASMDFIRYACQEIAVQLPLHAACKQALVFQEGTPHKKEVIKCERFLFDWLAVSRSSTAFVAKREEVYAPVKNAQGEESIETAQKALLQADIKRYQAVTGRFPQAHRFELDLAFHYPFDDVKETLESRQLTEGAYIPY
jgi:UDP-N-acetylglucosamine/UDP-N-acetylgalactosamine diphosphorylase